MRFNYLNSFLFIYYVNFVSKLGLDAVSVDELQSAVTNDASKMALKNLEIKKKYFS
jgi:hypothetical protein